MDYAGFLARQEEIYARFRAEQDALRQEGSIPDAVATGRKGGICIVLLPEVTVAQALSDLSGRLASALPTISYPPENIHTTISDHGVADGRVVADDDATLARISETVARSTRDHLAVLRACKIDLGQPLANRSTVIFPGVPNAAFLDLAEMIQSACATEGIELRLPWGGHSTIARFRHAVAVQDLAPFWKILEDAPRLGNQHPVALEIRSFTCTENTFLMHTHTRIEPT